jgi:CyaY protein
MTAPYTTPLSDADYHARCAEVFALIEASVDVWLQSDVIDIDSQRTGGLLELTFQAGSKIVINTQPPLQELWLAAKSGGYHFKYRQKAWTDTRDGRDFFDVLSDCVSEQAGQSLRFGGDARNRK